MVSQAPATTRPSSPRVLSGGVAYLYSSCHRGADVRQLQHCSPFEQGAASCSNRCVRVHVGACVGARSLIQTIVARRLKHVEVVQVLFLLLSLSRLPGYLVIYDYIILNSRMSELSPSRRFADMKRNVFLLFEFWVRQNSTPRGSAVTSSTCMEGTAWYCSVR